ncbi:hypothetical protein NAEGRDRAFT_58715 [Naegleria gruberi]|uniref:Uncharacterized protein n=1 Tax=Naegleria gruberi TaxID=5762 RepID=D2VMY3_NAEGR|nr:uncharacterized protein NAEGRDRAFT_58715 [Naegleria gruberi]EFC41823.1 hypothetical protein NAEGRDRAFT_58715 [Naegleria gruberi]|eukprot:XP_002674567.1 hypothetical protein NAEGRDRAFT_58715 [Naegleria gruberi strain NEG-M]
MPVTTTSSPSNNIPADPQEIKKNNRLTVIQSNNQSFYSNMSSATTTEINSDSKLNQLSTLSTEEGSSGISRRTTPSSQTFGEGGIEGLSNLGRRGRRGSLEHEVKHPVALSKTLDQKVPLMEFIVQKRVENLEYIRKFHEGQVFWMNTVKVSPSEIEKAYQSQTLQKRLEQWFTLGMSMAPLIQIDNGYEFVRACSQLLEEFEYHFSNMAVQGMKILKAFTNNFVDDDTPPVITSQKTIKPSIHKSNGSVVYEFLQTPNIPCTLDYCQIIFSLCDLLIFVYRKFLDEANIGSSLHEYIVKLDGKIKNNFIGLISRDISALAIQIVKTKLSNVQNMFSLTPQVNNQPITKRKGDADDSQKQKDVDEWFVI